MPFVLSDPAALLAAAEGHPLIRVLLRIHDSTAHGWSSGDALVWTADERPAQASRSVFGLGRPERVADLVGQVGHLLPEHCEVSVPRAAADLLTGAVRLTDRTDWDFRWTPDPPPRVPGEDAVRVLSADTHPEVSALLDRANPTASARPEDPWVRRWVGVRDDAGRLVAVAADRSRGDVSHIASVATEPGARGRGLGAAVTAYLARRQVEEFGFASLGFYPDNDPARRLYDRLGFGNALEMTSGQRTTGDTTAQGTA